MEDFESSPSGYETESSSDGDEGGDDQEADADDDTDIDGVFDEYISHASLPTISFPSSRSKSGKLIFQTL